MLAKKFRLPVGTFPRGVKPSGKNRYMAVVKIKNNLNHDRLGVVFRAKAFRGAALRNKLKRFVFDNAPIEKKTQKGRAQDILVILNPEILKLTKKELKDNLDKYVGAN